MRLARWLGIGVVGVLVLLVAADRIGVRIAQRAAADSLASSQHLPSRPQVDISGFPFLTQLAAGDFDKITVEASDVPVTEGFGALVLSRLHVVLHHLSVSRDFHSFHADTASATAVVAFEDLGKALGVPVTYAGSGRVRAGTKVTVRGVSVPATVTARPRLRNGELTFADPVVNDAAASSRSATALLDRLFAVAIPLQHIPFDVRVRTLAVSPSGVTITFTGRGLSYVR